MKITPNRQNLATRNQKPAQEQQESNPVVNAAKDFFTYSSRENDPHEGFLYGLGQDLKHSLPFTAKLGATGAVAGLALGAVGLTLGSALVLPVVGGVAGLALGTHISDKADHERNMKMLAGIAGWSIPSDNS
jgi:hypothetical protein